MLLRVCHPYRVLSFSLLWCTSLCHIFALASPLIRRGPPYKGEFTLKMSWRIGQEYQRVSNGYTGAEHFGFLFSGQGKFALEAYKVSTGGLPKVVEVPVNTIESRPSGKTHLPFYKTLDLHAKFGSDKKFFTSQITTIMDPEKLIEETNELLKKRNEKYFIGKDKVKDDVDWMHVTLMYLSMVEYAPGQTVLQEPDVYNFWFLHHWKDIKALRQEFLEDSKHHISSALGFYYGQSSPRTLT
ncbi:hypothetical protein FB446DRAFT_745030 [Lentinula raphanica]|nr:hypothetical protein FB446DRAFT_745030 [Lentinula raphanica]